jgi:dihydrodipicolinate synthase/N-acetylneuraminate lyase
MSDNSGGVIAGLFAAVATPIHGDGRIDFDTFGRVIDFLVEAGVAGVCLGGATLLVGDDRALYRGLQTGWNGGISGVAGFCPELLVALYRSHVERRFDETARLQVLLDELISQIAPLPTPWGIRVGLAARGIDTGPLPLPLSAARTARIAAFRKWLPEWLVQHGLDRSVDAAAKITRR